MLTGEQGRTGCYKEAKVSSAPFFERSVINYHIVSKIVTLDLLMSSDSRSRSSDHWLLGDRSAIVFYEL